MQIFPSPIPLWGRDMITLAKMASLHCNSLNRIKLCPQKGLALALAKWCNSWQGFLERMPCQGTLTWAVVLS